MKHLKLFEDINKSGKLDMLGVVIYATGYDPNTGDMLNEYHAFVYPTLWDISDDFLQKSISYSENSDDIYTTTQDMLELSDLLNLDSSQLGEPNWDVWTYVIWTGLVPKSQSKKHEIISSSSPYVISGELEKIFSNVSSVMKNNPEGTIGGKGKESADMDVVVASLKNDLSKLYLYKGSKDIEKIATGLGMSAHDTKSVMGAYSSLRYL